MFNSGDNRQVEKSAPSQPSPAEPVPTGARENREGVLRPYRAPKKRRPEAPPRSPRGCWSTGATYFGLAFLIMTVVFAVMLLAFTSEVTDFLDDPVDNFLEIFGIDRGKTTPEVTETRIIVLGIKQMSVLETVRGDILVQKEVVQEKTSILKDAKMRIQFYGRLTAGIDLSQIGEGDVNIRSATSVQVHLPPAQITGCYLQDPEILESSCGTSFFGAANCSDTFQRLQETAYERGIVDLLQAAEELNLLDEAIQNAEISAAGLLSEFGFTDIEFVRSEVVLPPDETCLPR